ncbi:MAG: HAD-IA family hydrolase [Clostridia bacterium]|nr:HAD-IA family hydrolase [Clostridia bacterium]
MIRLVIFDMDGVLVDSEDAITRAALQTLREDYGLPAQYEDFKPFTGMGERVFIGSVAEKYGVSFCEEMRTRTYQIYCETADERVTVFPWARTLPRQLKALGYHIAVGSAADDVKVQCNLRCIGAKPSDFDALVTASEVVRKKPDPEIFLNCAEKCGIAPSECLVFEDAVSGVQAAKAGGMRCIAVTSSFDRQTLLDAGADCAVDDLTDAADLIKEF